MIHGTEAVETFLDSVLAIQVHVDLTHKMLNILILRTEKNRFARESALSY
ncbi:hypothetical protein ACFOSW_02015 [Paenibacillus sp. GCM10012303]